MARNYSSFVYIYPPRPERVAPPSFISKVKDTHWGQPKLNGSYGIFATNGKEWHFMNRSKETFKNKLLITKEELLGLHRGKGWIYLCGEYMNKSQKGVDRKVFNGKFVIFDILVFENQWLTGTTFQSRQELLDMLYGTTKYDFWIEKITDNCFRALNFKGELLEAAWKKLVTVDMYEGMVFKRPEAELELSVKSVNNAGWQFKVRKPTKNYSY